MERDALCCPIPVTPVEGGETNDNVVMITSCLIFQPLDHPVITTLFQSILSQRRR